MGWSVGEASSDPVSLAQAVAQESKVEKEAKQAAEKTKDAGKEVGDKAEDAFRQSMLMSQGSLKIFVSNGLVATMTALALILLFWPLLTLVLRRLGPARGNAAQPGE